VRALEPGLVGNPAHVRLLAPEQLLEVDPLERLACLAQAAPRQIIEQALDRMPGGPFWNEAATFKVRPPKGEIYFGFESARGQTGYYLVSDGTPYPYRCHIRVPSYGNLHVLTEVLRGTMMADAISILGSIDVVIPEIDR